MHRVHGHAHVVHPVERVEDAEDVDAVLGRLLRRSSAPRCRRSWCSPPRWRRAAASGTGCWARPRAGGEPLPRVFLEEAHGDVEGGAAPAFQREQLRQHARVVRRDRQHVVRAHAGGEQRLVRVAHGGVGEQHLLLVAHPVGRTSAAPSSLKRSRVPPAAAGACRSQCGLDRRGQRQCGSGAALHLRVAVDRHVADELEQARGAVAPLAGSLNSSGVSSMKRVVHSPRAKQRVGDDVFQELQVGGQRRARGTRAGRGPCAAIASSAVWPQAVTLTSSES